MHTSSQFGELFCSWNVSCHCSRWCRGRGHCTYSGGDLLAKKFASISVWCKQYSSRKRSVISNGKYPLHISSPFRELRCGWNVCCHVRRLCCNIGGPQIFGSRQCTIFRCGDECSDVGHAPFTITLVPTYSRKIRSAGHFWADKQSRRFIDEFAVSDSTAK